MVTATLLLVAMGLSSFRGVEADCLGADSPVRGHRDFDQTIHFDFVSLCLPKQPLDVNGMTSAQWW